jgi:uncharacterized membrane protein
MSRPPGPAERFWHFLTLVSIGSLFSVFALLRLFADEPAGSVGSVVLLAAQTLPLLVFVPPLLAASARAGALLGFIAPLYAVGAIMTLVDPEQRLAGGAELFFSLTLFLAATLFARERGRRGA